MYLKNDVLYTELTDAEQGKELQEIELVKFETGYSAEVVKGSYESIDGAVAITPAEYIVQFGLKTLPQPEAVSTAVPETAPDPEPEVANTPPMVQGAPMPTGSKKP